MSYNTGLQATANGYTYWSMPESNSVTMTILNAGVDVGFGTTLGAGGPEAAQYPPADEYFPPGSLIRPQQFDAVRIRSHIANTPAQYSIAGRLDAPSNMGASFSPTYLTIDPVTGQVSANFTGLVNALGVVIPESSGTALQLPNAIEWVDQNPAFAGTVREVVEGQSPTNGVHRLAMLAQQGSQLAQFTAQAASQATLRADTDAAGVQIIAADGTSDLVQLATTQRLALDWGQGTANYAASNTAVATVAHNLGRTPRIAFAGGTIGGSLFFSVYVVGVLGANSSTIQFQTELVDPSTTASGSFIIDWIALG